MIHFLIKQTIIFAQSGDGMMMTEFSGVHTDGDFGYVSMLTPIIKIQMLLKQLKKNQFKCKIR